MSDAKANVANMNQARKAPVAIPEFTPQHRDALLLAIYKMLQHQQPQQAMVLLRAILLVQPKETRLLKYLAYAQVALNQHKDALKTVELCMEDGDAVDPVVYLIQSWALQGLERKDEARAQFRRYVEMLNLS
ncbi:MAG: hypothetical protein ACFCBW_07780 [Candidatus Competibacterales bacterium]